MASFQWDDGNWPKCGSHGLTKAAIQAIFDDPATFIGPDLDHSDLEERFHAVGVASEDGRRMLVVFTVRSADDGPFVRPISARYMHNKEVRRYVRDIEDEG